MKLNIPISSMPNPLACSIRLRQYNHYNSYQGNNLNFLFNFFFLSVKYDSVLCKHNKKATQIQKKQKVKIKEIDWYLRHTKDVMTQSQMVNVNLNLYFWLNLNLPINVSNFLTIVVKGMHNLYFLLFVCLCCVVLFCMFACKFHRNAKKYLFFSNFKPWFEFHSPGFCPLFSPWYLKKQNVWLVTIYM